MHQRSVPRDAWLARPIASRMRLFAPVSVDEPVRLQCIGARRCLDVHDDAVRQVLDPRHAALPADHFAIDLADAVDQEPLEVELLQVDERRLLGQAVVFEVEGEDLVAARERAAHRPGDALGANALVQPHAREGLETLLRIADAPRRGTANADGVVFVEQHDGDAAQHQIARQREPRQATTGNDDRGAAPFGSAELGRHDERPRRQLVGRRELPRLGGGIHDARYSASAKAAISSATRSCRSARPAR